VLPGELFKAIGARVRARRLDQHLTLDALSARSGVSRRMITMLEAGETNASLGTLDKLARALELDFAMLVAVRPVPALTPETARSVEPVWHDDRGSSARLLDSRPAARVVELWQWELAGSARYDAVADPPGSEELLFVDAGRLVVEIDHARYTLEEGQYLRLPTDRPYAYVNQEPRAARFTRVVVIP
jgi:transcriptional regulator with XRE-family HTH domain